MSVPVASILGVIFAIAATVVLYILVLPDAKRPQLHGFLAFVHDFLNLKYLLIEKIFKFFYILNTMLFICVGFFLLFGRYDLFYDSRSTFLYGLLMIILGPIVSRLLYELFMLQVLLVKNAIEINNKIKGDASGATSQFDAPKVSDFIPKAPAAPYTVPAAHYAPAAPANPYAAPADPYAAPPVAPEPPTTPAAPYTPVVPVTEPASPAFSEPEAPRAPEVPIAPEPPAAPAGPKVCGVCGAEIPDEGIFCPNCGTHI